MNPTPGLQPIARPDPRDGYALPPDDTDYTKKLTKLPKQLKIGFALRFGDHPLDLAAAGDTGAPLREAMQRAREQGLQELDYSLDLPLGTHFFNARLAWLPGDIAEIGPRHSAATVAAFYRFHAGLEPLSHPLVAALNERRDVTIKYVETTDEDLRGRFFQMGPGREMDLYEMILMISGHAERHLLQMKEVTAAPGYPKK